MRGAKRMGCTPRRNTVAGDDDDGVDVLSPQVALMHTRTHTITSTHLLQRGCSGASVPRISSYNAVYNIMPYAQYDYDDNGI